jgi:hypothetical protein
MKRENLVPVSEDAVRGTTCPHPTPPPRGKLPLREENSPGREIVS